MNILVVAGMYKKMLILAFIVFLISSMAQPTMAAHTSSAFVPGKVLAAWQPLNQTPGDLRLQRTKTAVTAGIDLAIGTLEDAENGLERTGLTESQKAELRGQIGSNITWLEGKRQDVQSSKDVAGALQNAKQASEHWNAAYPGLKKEIGLMACDNFDAELNKAGRATTIVSARIDALKAQGKDTKALNDTLTGYSGHVDGAARDVAGARSEFNAITAPNDGHFAAGLRQLRAADKEIKDAYPDLKTIYRQLLASGGKAT